MQDANKYAKQTHYLASASVAFCGGVGVIEVADGAAATIRHVRVNCH
jgi:hypothetical protein